MIQNEIFVIRKPRIVVTSYKSLNGPIGLEICFRPADVGMSNKRFANSEANYR